MSPVCDVGVRWVAGHVVPHGVMGEWSLPLGVGSEPCAMLCFALSLCCALDMLRCLWLMGVCVGGGIVVVGGRVGLCGVIVFCEDV